MNGIWKIQSRGSAMTTEDVKNEEVAKMSKAVVEMTSNFNLGVDEDDIEELLEAVPEELTNEELLELEHKRIAKDEARENCSRRKRTPKKIQSEWFIRRFCRFNKLLKI
jgi:5'-3' exonuclease